MSADNWRVCPRCKRDKVIAAEAGLAAVRHTYGVAPPDDFVQSLAAAQQQMDEASRFGNREVDCEFREDYSIGTYEMTDGSALFEVHYSGRCRSCGFSKDFDHTEAVS